MNVVEVPLTRNMFATIDADNAEIILRHKWAACKDRKTCGLYYARAMICGVLTSMHHMIIGFPIRGMVVDHKDFNGLNNILANFRVVTQSQNCINRRKQKGEYTSKYKGVSSRTLPSHAVRWRSHIYVRGKLVTIGSFDTEIEAAIAYNMKAMELHGCNAYLNTFTQNK